MGEDIKKEQVNQICEECKKNKSIYKFGLCLECNEELYSNDKG